MNDANAVQVLQRRRLRVSAHLRTYATHALKGAVQVLQRRSLSTTYIL
jgi:hypothetical protein